MKKTDFVIQLVKLNVKQEITEVKESLDGDYKYLIGITIPDRKFSVDATLESIKIKGNEFLPEGLELSALISSRSVEPNKRFFTLFKPIEIKGDDIVLKIREPKLKDSFDINIQLLLSNNPEEMKDVLDN